MKIFVFRKMVVFVALSMIFIVGALLTYFAVKPTSTPQYIHSIVIDAGHGGRDGGTSGKYTGVTESELNLKYAQTLQNICEEIGFKTIMTRSDMGGLYDELAQNKKKSEMEKRKNIINSSGADIMVSIHMNSFPLSSCSGAQVFYAKGSDSGFALAKAVQTSICKNFKNARNYVTVGDYYVLNFSNIPAILIECGFLSNPEEEKKLQDNKYCEDFCYNILSGIISFFQA